MDKRRQDAVTETESVLAIHRHIAPRDHLRAESRRCSLPPSRAAPARVLSSLSAIEPVMTRVSFEIELPDTLAEQAREAGLLEPSAVERLVREALLGRHVDNLGRAREVLAVDPLPPMTPEEIQAEIDAYRSEVRRS
jgi:hypothetical protein